MFRYQTHELRYQNKCFKYEIYILMLIHLSLAREDFIHDGAYALIDINTIFWGTTPCYTMQIDKIHEWWHFKKHSIQLTTIHDKLSCNKWFYFFYYMYTIDITKHFLAIIPWLSRIRFAILLYSLKYFT